MKTFDQLFEELEAKVSDGTPSSGTVRLVREGKHAIGKKILEEAGEVWLAAEHEGKERTAEEISQLLYHLEAMMLTCEGSLEDVYNHL